MAKFTVRVELHNVTYDTGVYTVLHQSMEDLGFTSTVKGANKEIYKLPSAEYNYSGKKTIEEIHNLTKDAVAKTNRKGSILISQIMSRKWSNLEKADPLDVVTHLISELEED